MHTSVALHILVEVAVATAVGNIVGRTAVVAAAMYPLVAVDRVAVVAVGILVVVDRVVVAAADTLLVGHFAVVGQMVIDYSKEVAADCVDLVAH